MKSKAFWVLIISLSCMTAPHPGPAAPAVPATPASGKKPDQLLRDTWYTMTVNKTVKLGYYNERVELKGGRVFLQAHIWTRDEDFINEDQLGAFAENNPDLTPLFYNFHSTYRSTETIVDGTVTDGKMLSMRVRRAGAEPTSLKRSIPSGKTIFSQLFPVWLGKKLPELENGKSLSFYAILEDKPDAVSVTVPGRVKLEKPDELARSTKTRKISVMFQDHPSMWWVEDSGAAVRIEMFDSGTVVEKTTKEKALSFLK